ncbi:MAG: AAA family ATPase [Prosthecochloris sp.]|nr:AAA family ATPase [Prosthecochloris sp.]
MEHDTRLQELNAEIIDASGFMDAAGQEISRHVVGQQHVLERVFTALLCNGHVLLEGVPGLAKTLIVHTFSSVLDLDFRRIQFTPDMLPADLVGTMIYDPKKMDFFVRKGAVFSNVILADEINRSPAKVQSALLEAMQERQVTIGEETFPLPEPFLVLATQNPIEHEGTYALPEAQLDRFMMKVMVGYPSCDEEMDIMERAACSRGPSAVRQVVEYEDIARARSLVDRVYADKRVRRYIVDLVIATRDPETAGIEGLSSLVEYGASPRASIFLLLAAKAHAFLHKRPYITPEDVKTMVFDVLRHRLRMTCEAEADNVTPDECIDTILQHVQVP